MECRGTVKTVLSSPPRNMRRKIIRFVLDVPHKINQRIYGYWRECNDKNLWLSHLQDEKLFHEKNEKNILLIFFLYLSDFGDK